MNRNLARRFCALFFVTLSIAVLIVAIASVAPAQMISPGQPLARPHSESGAVDSGNPPIFLPAVLIEFGGLFSAQSIAIADISGDGKADMVAVGYEVRVLMGNGDGTFQPEMSYFFNGHYPIAVVVADVNGDGKPDLLMADQENALGVMLGNGDGTFRDLVAYPSGGESPSSLAVGDLNGDGKLDAVLSHWNGTLAVLLGNGDGTFRAPIVYSADGTSTRSVAVADVNLDGKLDLVASNWSSASGGDPNGLVGVLLGNGDGTFQPAATFGSGGYDALSVWASDANGDGKPDLLVMSLAGSNGSLPGVVGVLLGNGDGTFQPVVDYTPGQLWLHSLAVADVNGDHKPDLVVTSGNSDDRVDGIVSILLGNGDGTFQTATTYDSGAFAAAAVTLGDINGDTRPDLFVANICTHGNCNDGSVGMLLNNAGAALTTTTMVSNANPAVPRQIVTYAATVATQSGGVPTGKVNFQDGTRTVAIVALAGNQATYSTKYTRPGVHLMTAVYTGDLKNAGSTSDTFTEYVQGGSKTVLTTSGSPSFVGQLVTFTATVSATDRSVGTIPDGEMVTFYDGTTVLGSVALASGVASYTTSSLAAKNHAIKATYPGDSLFKPSHGNVAQVVEKYSTATTLISNPNPSAHGQAVTFTATVASSGPGMPSGKVTFKDGTTAIGTAPLSGGVATLTKSNLAVGTHPITAQYPGDAASAKSASAILNQVVR